MNNMIQQALLDRISYVVPHLADLILSSSVFLEFCSVQRHISSKSC